MTRLVWSCSIRPASTCSSHPPDILRTACPAVIGATTNVPSGAQPPNTPGSPGVTVTNSKLITQFGGTSFSLNNARYVRFHWNVPGLTPQAILVLVPGFEGGANDFKILAENLLPRALANHGLVVEVWAFDRRTNQLEDLVGLDIAESLSDAQVGLDWLFGGELGLSLHPALAAGPNRRAQFYNPTDDVPFIANWTNLVFSRDIDAVVAAARAAVANNNVFLGGHSAGTGFAARYASTDFNLTGVGPADPGYARVKGLVLLEGGAGSTGGTPLTADTLDRIEAKFDGGLFGAVRDGVPRCVDGVTACTIATETTDCAGLDRYLTLFYAGGSNFTDWYYPNAGPSTTSVSGVCTSGICTVGNVGILCSANSDCSQAINLDSSALSIGRGRRDIENLTQAANINIPIIGFGGSNGLAPVPGRFVPFAQSIGVCTAPSCSGSTPRVVDALNPNPAFPTFGSVAGGFEVYINEGFAHVDVLTAEDNADNNVLAPLAAFLARNTQP